MLSRILGWLNTGSGGKKSQDYKRPARPGSATAHLFDKNRIASREPKAGPTTTESAGGFNPYDTGKFDRSASWERISKSQR